MPAPSSWPPLRRYQRQVAAAILESVEDGLGRTITVEIARQGGKNELAAQIEALLLASHVHGGGEIVKCAPTRLPQLSVSMRRLWARLRQGGLHVDARPEASAIRVGEARMHFLSASPQANVAGHTASLLLVADEAQHIDADKFERDFRPMAAAHNATTVLYGTAWDERTLIEQARQRNMDARRRDGGARWSFRFPWEAVARDVPAYAAYVESERARLGERHPLFLTQYCLEPLPGAGRFFSANDLRALAGAHARERHPAAGEHYAAGLDIAGGDDGAQGATYAGALPARRGRDSTVLLIARVAPAAADDPIGEPRVEIVEAAEWTGAPHERLLPQLIDALGLWRVDRVAIDATGIGETTARLAAKRLGEGRVLAVKFGQESKSRLGFELLAAVQTGRLKMFASDGSPEYARFWSECEQARAAYRSNRTLAFYVDAAEGHDDYVMALALLAHAARGFAVRRAVGRW